ncbi:MAG: DUF3050 domain-containing protein [Bacteroidetes bacterium]|nr:DUF3050 domain-containing protein [Bacteroidota bacterium]
MDATADQRQRLINHELYTRLTTLNDIRIFMEHHVFAVWDFMSLLKSLQQKLTCTTVPWLPVGNPDTRYLINEIVTGEESDIDETGKRCSHFELYLNAMEQLGCNMGTMNHFTTCIKDDKTVNEGLVLAGVPESAADFVRYTFEIIATGKPHIITSVFTFGREDLIPSIFIEIVRRMNTESPGQLAKLIYYLERHIEVDGDHHSKLAHEMTAELCGEDKDKWLEATNAARSALEARLALWDSIVQALDYCEASLM